MVKIRKATNQDKAPWDNYVKQHPECSPYHLFSWQIAIETAYKHQSYYLIAEEVNEIVGILPLVIFKRPFNNINLCALPFCDVGSVLANSEDIKEALISESKNVAGKYKAKHVDLRTSKTKELTEAENNQKIRMLMSLPDSSEVLFASFKSKLRSQIRKAEKNGLTYTLASNKKMLEDFYSVFSHNMRALGSPVHSKQWFIELFKCYQENMLISVVYQGTVPIGAGIVLISGEKASIPWASTKAEYNKLSPNMMLYWSFLKYLSDNSITEFDFGRSSYGEGTFKFKKQWGAKPFLLDWQQVSLTDRGYSSTLVTSTKTSKLRIIIESLWRKLPLRMTIFFGSKIRRFISL